MSAVADDAWKPTFLAELEQCGGKWIAARRAGVSRGLVLRELSNSAFFSQQCEDAVELYADSLEQALVHPGTRNVIGLIVRLKALRPALYLEKNITLGVSVTAETKVTPAQAVSLLKDMIGDLHPETREAIAAFAPPEGAVPQEDGHAVR